MFLKPVQFSFYLLCFFSALLNHSAAFTQEDNYVNYTTADGLPSNQVYKIIQDDIGYIWFLTDKGVSKYDGYEFENFSSADGLSDNVFFDAQKAEDGSIWMLGMNGTITIVRDQNIEAFKFNDTLIKYEYFKPARIALTRDAVRIYYLRGFSFLSISLDGNLTNEPFLFDNSSLASSKEFRFSFGTIDIFNRYYNSSTRSPTDIDVLHKSDLKRRAGYNDNGFLLPSSKIMILMHSLDSVVITEDNVLKQEYLISYMKSDVIDSNYFWISKKSGGVFIFNREGLLIDSLLDEKIVSNIWTDNNGFYWISTLYNGVFRQKSSIVNSEIKAVPIKYLESNSEKGLYIGYRNGAIYKRESGSYSLITPGKSGIVSSMNYNTSSGALDYVVDNFLYSEYGNKPFNKERVSHSGDLLLISKDSFAVCSANGLDLFGKRNRRVAFTGSAYSVVLNNAQLILGTQNGLFVQSYKNGQVSFVKNELYGKRINKVIFFKNHFILGTQGDGILVINKDLSEIKLRITKPDLPSNFISNLSIKNDSVLWVSTNNGFSTLTFDKHLKVSKSMSVNKNKGLTSLQINDIILVDDTVWIASEGGLFSMRDIYFSTEKESINYKLQFTALLIDDQERSPSEFGLLSHDIGRLSFFFTVLSFDNNKIEYRYRLNGLENEWNYTNERKILYNSLSPGEYKLVVQVKGENKTWEENELSLAIVISPPYWTTWWFYLLITAGSISLIVLFFRVRILLYNRDLVRELLRQFLKRLKRKRGSIVVRSGNKEVKIFSADINFVKSDGNYVEIIHAGGKTVIRHKIGEFLDLVPDPIEFIQIRRSYIIRIDKVDELGKDYVVIGKQRIKVGSTYQEELKKIKL